MSVIASPFFLHPPYPWSCSEKSACKSDIMLARLAAASQQILCLTLLSHLTLH